MTGPVGVGGGNAAPWRVIAAALIIGALAWLMALPDTVSAPEEWVFRLFNDLPDWLEVPTWPIMQLGALAMVPLSAGAAYLAWKDWRPAVALLIAGSTAWLLSRVIKEMVARGRPGALLDDVNVRPAWDGLGFISGHATIAFALATILSPHLGRVGTTLVWSGALATGCLRMYTGAHLPLDVVGGAALGVALGSVTSWAVGAIRGGAAAKPEEGREQV